MRYSLYKILQRLGQLLQAWAGIAQLARASAFQAEGRGFESRFPLQRAY